MINKDPKKIDQVLTRGVVEILPSKEKLKELMLKRKIRVYLGIDPTGAKLHLGHTIPLKKLQEFADLGHEAILVIGTGTVLAGDPSLREEERPMITKREIEKNIKNWKEQAKKILDLKKIKIRYNGDWLLKLKLEDIIKIASKISAVKLFQREMFQKRIEKGGTVWTHEFLYPLLQGFDSVFLKTDLEIGGTDQLFNMLIGRELEEKILKKEKFILTCPMILGTDGRPMSKSSGNCIWVLDRPEQIYGKIMSLPDNLIFDYFRFLTDLPLKKIEGMKSLNPREAKARLAREITAFYHGERLAKKAEEEFERVFKEKKLPTKIPSVKISERFLNILDLLAKTKLAKSKSEAKRLVLQKGVRIDGKVKEDWKEKIKIEKGMVIKVGKRKFIRII
jgi:tyrosyl-tRNA synthetase